MSVKPLNKYMDQSSKLNLFLKKISSPINSLCLRVHPILEGCHDHLLLAQEVSQTLIEEETQIEYE